MRKIHIKHTKNLPTRLTAKLNADSVVPSRQQELELLEQLESAHDEFLLRAAGEGYNVETDPDVGQIEMQQFSVMKQLAEKLGLPLDKYNEKIQALRGRMLGKEVAEKYFPQE